jgi:hypothetical protein
MYFDNFDKIYYDFEINGKTQKSIMTNIMKNVRIRKEVLSNITLYDQYIIRDGESPEFIAEKVYGKPEYHWAIMLANDMYDYLNDFPLAERSMPKMISDKYGEDHVYDVHHYQATVDGQIFIVSQDPGGVSRSTYSNMAWNNEEPNPYVVAVSNSDYEYSVNESKRVIKIISPTIIEQVAAELSKL